MPAVRVETVWKLSTATSSHEGAASKLCTCNLALSSPLLSPKQGVAQDFMGMQPLESRAVKILNASCMDSSIHYDGTFDCRSMIAAHSAVKP